MEILQKKGLRETDFRKTVLKVFQKHSNAITINTIEKALKEFDRITLYRTIKIFIEKGVIHEISLNGKETNYALCSDCSEDDHKHQHIHFKCDECNKVYCVEVEYLPKIELKGYKINQLEIQASGKCNNCS